MTSRIKFGYSDVIPSTPAHQHPLFQFVEYRVNSLHDIEKCRKDQRSHVAHLPDVTDPQWEAIVEGVAAVPGATLVNVHARPADEYSLCYDCYVRLVNTRTAGQCCDYCGLPLDPEQIEPEKGENTFAQVVKKLGWAAEVFSRQGKRLTIENTYEPPDLMRRVLDALPAEVGFTLDTGHSLLYHANTTDYIHLLRDRLTHLHLHDNMGGNSERYHDNHLPPGSGIANWFAIARALRQAKFQGTAILECKPNPEWAMTWVASLDADRSPT